MFFPEFTLIFIDGYFYAKGTDNAFLSRSPNSPPPSHKIVCVCIPIWLDYLQVVIFVIIIFDVSLVQSCCINFPFVNKNMKIFTSIKILINWGCSFYNNFLDDIFLYIFRVLFWITLLFSIWYLFFGRLLILLIFFFFILFIRFFFAFFQYSLLLPLSASPIFCLFWRSFWSRTLSLFFYFFIRLILFRRLRWLFLSSEFFIFLSERGYIFDTSLFFCLPPCFHYLNIKYICNPQIDNLILNLKMIQTKVISILKDQQQFQDQ